MRGRTSSWTQVQVQIKTQTLRVGRKQYKIISFLRSKNYRRLHSDRSCSEFQVSMWSKQLMAAGSQRTELKGLTSQNLLKAVRHWTKAVSTGSYSTPAEPNQTVADIKLKKLLWSKHLLKLTDLKKQKNKSKAQIWNMLIWTSHIRTTKITFPSFLHGSWLFLTGTRFSSPTICKQHTEGGALANEGGAWLRRLMVGRVWSADCCRRRRGRTSTQLQQKTAVREAQSTDHLHGNQDPKKD